MSKLFPNDYIYNMQTENNDDEKGGVVSKANQISDAVGIFVDNYKDMRDANTIGADKYFHAKANAEASQLGKVGETTAEVISNMREGVDYFKNRYLNGMSKEDAEVDGVSDQKANSYGRSIGKNNNKDDLEIYLKKYRPKGLNSKFKHLI